MKIFYLNESGSEQLTNETCSQLLQSPTLQALDVSFCPHLTDEAFSQIKAPLIFLNIQGCANITDKTLIKLHQLKTLKYLCLAFNEKITKTALSALENLPLERLKIYPLDL